MVRFALPQDWLSLGQQNTNDSSSTDDSSTSDDIPQLLPRAPSPEINQSNLPPDAAPDGILPRSNPKLNQAWRDFYSKSLTPPTSSESNTANPLRQTMQPSLFPSKNFPAGSTFTPEYNGMRCWISNANTVLLSNDLAEFHELCHSLKQHSVGILAIQEVNQNLLDRNIYNQIEDVLKLHFGACVLVSSTTPIHSPTAWKPGGTILAVLGTWSHTVSTVSSDSLGR
jgi:hypothetical protein